MNFLLFLIRACLDIVVAFPIMPKDVCLSIKFEAVVISGGARPLSWAIRIRVAIDTARGLSFLHDSEQPVIYRDFKASNILLDSVCWLKNEYQYVDCAGLD